MDLIHRLIEWCAIGIELLAVAVMVAGVLVFATTRGTIGYVLRRQADVAGESHRQQLGRPLLLGLELLVAADVIRTVALEPTLTNVAVLGLLVLVRTFLSWSLSVEMEGRWPWQGHLANSREPAITRRESA